MKKIIKPLLIVLAVFIISTAVFAVIKWDHVELWYLYATKSINVTIIIEEGEKAYILYRKESPEIAIKALRAYEAKLEYEITKFKYWENKDPGFFKPINHHPQTKDIIKKMSGQTKRDVLADLGLTCGRIAKKYNEIGNSVQHDIYVKKAYEFLKQSMPSKCIAQPQDVIPFIDKLDEGVEI